MFDLVLPSLLLASLAFFAYFYFSRVNKDGSIDLEKILEREQKTKIEFEKKLELLQNQVITLKENNAKLDSAYINLNSNYKELESSSTENVKLLEKQIIDLSEEKRKKLFNLIDQSFHAKRKTIGNNLKSFEIDWSLLNIDQSMRAEELSLQEFEAILNHV